MKITGIDLNFLGLVDKTGDRAIVRVYTGGGECHISHLLAGLRDEDVKELKRAGMEAMEVMNKFVSQLKERKVEVVNLGAAEAEAELV